MEPNSTFNLSEVADLVNEQIKRIDTRLQDVNSDLSWQGMWYPVVGGSLLSSGNQ